MRTSTRALVIVVVAAVAVSSALATPSSRAAAGPAAAAPSSTATPKANPQAQALKTVPPRYHPTLLRVDSLARAGQIGPAQALLEPIIAEARVRADRKLLAFVLRMRGTIYASRSQPGPSLPPLREAITLARAIPDSTTLIAALRWICASASGEERRRALAEMLSLARSLHLPTYEASATLGMAWDSLVAGRFDAAARGYRRAYELQLAAGDESQALNALVGVGRVYTTMAKYDSARAVYERVRRRAHEIDSPYNEANAANNLGVIETLIGDPARAVELHREAARLHRSYGDLANSVIANLNVGQRLVELRRWDEAEAVIMEALDDAQRAGSSGQIASARNHLGKLAAARGRNHDAVKWFRAALAMGDSALPFSQAESLMDLAEALAANDSAAAALALLDRELPGLLGRVEAARAAAAVRIRARLVLDTRPPAEAIEAAERSLAQARLAKSRQHEIGSLVLLGRSLDLAGRREEAIQKLQEAASLWEADRKVPLDPAFRAARRFEARELAPRLAAMLLGEKASENSVRQAFDVLQRFKARTLVERVVQPGTDEGQSRSLALSPVTADQLQRDVLRPGEVLLDLHVGFGESFLFAVTRERCVVARLPGRDSLEGRVRLYRAMTAEPPNATRPRDATVERAGGALGRALFGEVAEVIAASHRVLFSPDGSLNLVGPAALALATDPRGAPRPLVVDHEVVIVPSATLLAAFRSRPDHAGTGPTRVLAVAATRLPDGTPLPGAEREVRDLHRWYTPVEQRLGTPASPVHLRPDELREYEVLHLASHTSVDDQRPWRSGVWLAAGDTSEDAAYLRAATIAGLKLPARLAVLAGCESAGGLVLDGEGVQGLSSAFLCAGVPAVVATLWPVDDATAAELMRRFYRHLSAGRGAAEALRRAQLELRGRGRTRDPFYWAGFVLIGDGDVHAPLRRRPSIFPVWIGLAVVLFATLVASRRRAARNEAWRRM